MREDKGECSTSFPDISIDKKSCLKLSTEARQESQKNCRLASTVSRKVLACSLSRMLI